MLLTAVVLAEVNGDAFFNLFKSSSSRHPSAIRPKVHGPRQPGRSVKSYGGSSFGKSNNYPGTYSKGGKKPSKPHFVNKPAYPQQGRPYSKQPRQPSYPRPKPARAPAPGHKLDYSGWKPIGFDEKKPAAAAAPVTNYSPDVVTVDVAIANAPPAQSDSIYSPAPVYSAPAPEPIVQEPTSYSAPAAPAPAYSPALPALVKPQPVTSTYGSPVPAVPYIPSTADIVTSYSPKPQYKPKKYNQPKYQPKAQYSAPKPQYNSPNPQYKSPKPQYNSPAPAPAYKAPAPAASYDAPAPARAYKAPSPAKTYNAPAPVKSYSAPAPVKSYSAPAPAPAYKAPTPAYKAPSPAKSYNAPAPAYKTPTPSYNAPAPTYSITTPAPVNTYNNPRPAPTKAPVVLPTYTPAPSAYDPSAFGDEEFPIISLITGDSDVAEEDKFVAFSFGGEYNAPVKYQNTREASQLAEEVSSGSVYVQNTADAVSNDELYYIYYQDPEPDPSYGVKVKKHFSSRITSIPPFLICFTV